MKCSEFILLKIFISTVIVFFVILWYNPGLGHRQRRNIAVVLTGKNLARPVVPSTWEVHEDFHPKKESPLADSSKTHMKKRNGDKYILLRHQSPHYSNELKYSINKEWIVETFPTKASHPGLRKRMVLICYVPRT